MVPLFKFNILSYLKVSATSNEDAILLPSIEEDAILLIIMQAGIQTIESNFSFSSKILSFIVLVYLTISN